jgi:HPr kinase/phosphorylase
MDRHPFAINEKNRDGATAPSISVREFLSDMGGPLGLEIVAGAVGMDTKSLTSPRIQKLGLALAGFADYVHQGRIQIVGKGEISFLGRLESEKRLLALRNLRPEQISCLIVTKGLEVPEELLSFCQDNGLPLLRSPEVSSKVIGDVTRRLSELLAPHVTVHGVLMGMFGLGIMLQGESGVGKSECALDLISRGHRLIVDDSIHIRKVGEKLVGSAPEMIRGYMEIRGLGIVNIRELFGVSVIGRPKPIELCIEFRRWDDSREIDRLGLDTGEELIMGVRVPRFTIPVTSGRNMATLVETAVRLHLLRQSGFESTEGLLERHARIVGAGYEED